MSDSLWPHGLQHTRIPCPSLSPGVYSNSNPLRRWCYPTILSCHSLFLLPSVFPRIKVFPNESALCIRWPKYWSFSFSISLSNEYSGLISFRIHWLDILTIQETLKNLLKCHSLKISILGAQPSLWPNSHPWASLIDQLVKNLPAMQKTLVQFLG